jgi:hypothetical protein
MACLADCEHFIEHFFDPVWRGRRIDPEEEVVGGHAVFLCTILPSRGNRAYIGLADAVRIFDVIVGRRGGATG